MNSMRVIGYTYEADCHCVQCAKTRHQARGFTINTNGPEGADLDEHDIPYGATDREGNFIHPIFPTDEMQYDEDGKAMDTVCGDCSAIIQEA